VVPFCFSEPDASPLSSSERSSGKHGGQRNHPQHEKKKQIMSIYRKEALNPSERNSPFIFGKIQTAPAAINNREKLFLPNQIS
jgi:hypothetical protein